MEDAVMSMLSIGQIIRMQVIDAEGKQGLTYKTRVADIDSNYIYIEVPITDEGRPLYAIKDTEFVVTYLDSNHNNYHFTTKIAGHRTENVPLLMFAIPNPDDIQKIQKRGFFRVKANLDLAVKLNDKNRNYHIVTKTVDIGGGGISFLAPLDKTFVKEDRLKMWCVLSSKNIPLKRLTFETEVVRVHPVEENSKHQMISVKFVDLRESESEAIIKYCFDRQIELYKKHEEV